MRKRGFFCFVLIAAMLFTASAMALKKTTLYRGCTGKEVVKLQQTLISRHFLSGKADGVYGDQTEKAVKAFQKAYGLMADGMAGEKTLELLYDSQKSSRNESTALREGSKGDRVVTMQKKLISLGYLGGTADGTFGAKTKEAVKYFQKSHDLPVDGVAGKKTLAMLNSGKAKSANEANPNPGPKGDLYLGLKGDTVTALQQKLLALGYSVKVTGKFDHRTKEAVMAFQRKNGLEVDGTAGTRTQKRLYSNKAIEAD